MLEQVRQSFLAVNRPEKDLTFEQIIRLYKEGDFLVRSQINRSAMAIGLAIYNFLNVLNINHIYLYGISCQLGEEFLEVIKHQVLSNPFDSRDQIKAVATSIEFGSLTKSEQIVGIGYLYGESLARCNSSD